MKSIKPGRGPSMMGGVMGIFVAIFGIFWTIMATGMGTPIFFTFFGIFFVIMAVVQAVYNFKNATGKNRYSSYDIVDSHEEKDPWNEKFGQISQQQTESLDDANFCPYCGTPAKDGFSFCPNCGKRLP